MPGRHSEKNQELQGITGLPLLAVGFATEVVMGNKIAMLDDVFVLSVVVGLPVGDLFEVVGLFVGDLFVGDLFVFRSLLV